MRSADKPFPWGLWAFIGFVGWIVVMLAIGPSTLVIAAPAAGVLCGWAVGGLFNLTMRAVPASLRSRSLRPTPSPRLSGNRTHWERVYLDPSPRALSWFEPEPRGSLAIIDSLALPAQEPIVDVGGGNSRLAAALLERGHSDITVMDISDRALEAAKREIPEPERIRWVVGDVRTQDFGRRFSLWHDRALFHFMVAPEDQNSYLAAVERNLAPGGHIVIATFGPEGPTHCSGLPVVRYSAEELAERFEEIATLESHRYEQHVTPSGEPRQYVYVHLVSRRA